MSFFRNKPLVITVVILIILFVLLFATVNDKDVSAPQSAIGSVFAPMQSWLYGASNSISDFFDRVFATGSIQDENSELKTQVAELESQLTDKSELEKENERLKELLDFKEENTTYETIGADVIGKTPGVWFDTFTISAGRADGVEVDMPVITADGLVGKVTSVAQSYSQVTCIIDASSGVSVVVERTRDNGVAKGDGANLELDEDILSIEYLPIDSNLMPGDKVLTSGLDGIYPKGLYVGEIVEVSRDTVSSEDGENTEQKIAALKTGVDFKRLEEVMVVVGDQNTTSGQE